MKQTRISKFNQLQYYVDKPINYTLDQFPLVDSRVSRLDYKLSLCGQYATKKFYCRKDPFDEHLLKTSVSKFFCEIHYCDSPDCLVHRFARQIETFNDISRFDGLYSLWHLSIGFQPIPELEFKKDFSKYNRRFRSVLNRYFSNLRKKGINLQGIRVMDFSFKTEGMVYVHYHFGLIPVGQSRIRSTMIIMKQVEKLMISRMRVKVPFHFESFGLGSKKGILSYLAIRASGMYKYDMTSNPDYKHIESKLRDSIVHNKYIYLRSVITKEEYIKNFYNRSFFLTVGGLPRPLRHGSNITDGMPSECPIHGHLEKKDVRLEIEFLLLLGDDVKPPDLIKKYPSLVIIYQKM